MSSALSVMFFTLQKMIWFLMMPPASLILLMLAGLLVIKRQKKSGMVLISSGVALLYLLSLGHVADWILIPLERIYPPLTNAVIADAVVVPGGGSTDLNWLGAEPIPNAETEMRLIKGVELSKKLNIPLVLVGGNGEPFNTRVRDADAMAPEAARMGIPPSRMIVENESRNTLENSHAARKIVKGDRIILATSAYYMRRAVVLFQRRGFTVVPAPVYFLVESRKYTPAALMPGAANLARSTVGIAEWVSMVWWKVRGEM